MSFLNKRSPLWRSLIKEQTSITQPLQPGFDFEQLAQVRQKGDDPADQCSISQQAVFNVTPKGLLPPITKPLHVCAAMALWASATFTGEETDILAGSEVPKVASREINPLYNTKSTSNVLCLVYIKYSRVVSRSRKDYRLHQRLRSHTQAV